VDKPKKRAVTAGAKTTRRKAADDGSASVKAVAGKALVIVESPAKAKTLQKYLGPGYKIEASVGHVKDLPTSKLGVDIEGGFEPQYIVVKGKEKVIERICKSAAVASEIYLAPDPDREGEAIAWHIASELRAQGIDKPMHRATFNEITKRAVQEAIANPEEINLRLFEAQQSRRILDRLVGYQISPLLWKKVTRGLSAGRVQSVAVRMIVEREREIQGFVNEEYWTIEASVNASTPPPFEMRLAQIDGRKPQFSNAGEVRSVLEHLGAVDIGEATTDEDNVTHVHEPRKSVQARVTEPWTVSGVEKKDVRRHPAPPFITSTLQQEAARKLGFDAKRTMRIAQKLYEGLELGEEGMTALITYMRTDSTRLAPTALDAVREYIATRFGPDYRPADPNFYKTRKSAQDAHEAIRPTDMQYTPERVSQYLDSDQLRLYTLVWNRFVACQMADAIFEQTRVEATPREQYLFSATGLVRKFDGYLAVYEEGRDEGENGENGLAKLPAIEVGTALQVLGIRGSQHFTQPPPRFSESSLVKELERRGIGRPSTYASIVSVIQDKAYVEKDNNRKFRPTERGLVVTDLLVESLPEVLDIAFTAQMEEKLDEVEDGQVDWRQLLGDFYAGFSKRLEVAAVQMKDIKKEVIETDILCDKCGQANMVVKWGRNGRFLACPRYPECKNAREYTNGNGSESSRAEPVETDEICEACGRNLVVKNGRNGRFLACPGYPECKTVKPFKTGVKCPECHEGDLVERTSKRGKLFFSCSRYPECKHVLWNRPVPQPCPQCNSPFLILRQTQKQRTLVCPSEGCKYRQTLQDEPVPSEAQSPDVSDSE
jgi:DNA topoisomerase I